MELSYFRDPGLAYRGVTLWMLNDELEQPEIAKQIADFAKAGWGAFITRTFNGLRTPYLSEEWMAIIRQALDCAKAHGLKVWLQAGYMPSAIPVLSDADTHKVVVRKKKDEPMEKGETLLWQEGEYAYYRRLMPHVLDLLSKEAVRRYLHLAYEEPWWSRFASEFGQTVETVWVDEPHFRPPLLPWNDELPELFRQRWGYSLVEKLPALYAEVGDYRQVRHHYWRTVVDMFMEAYFHSVSEWCQAHGVKFGGHAMGEDSLHAQISWTGAAMRCYEHMQLPGIDHLTHSMYWPNGHKFIFTPKQCSSVANQLGWPDILAEMYGVSSQRITFEGRKEIGEWLMMLGINYRCYHGSFYSMRGIRKRIYPPHLSYQQPWWPDNRLIADYFARLSYALHQGQYAADALIVHSVESGFCTFDPNYGEPARKRQLGEVRMRHVGPPEMKALNDSLQQLSENLLAIQRGFEYGDEHLMALHGRVTTEGLAIGKMTYKVVILPSVITLRRSTVELLTAFMDAGGTVLAVGSLPTRIDGREEPSIAAFNGRLRRIRNEREALREALGQLVPPSVEINAIQGDAAHVWMHERKIAGGRLFFLADVTRDQAVEAEVKIRGSGKLEEWDLRTGEVKVVPQRREGEHIVTRLSFPPIGSHLLVFWENAEPQEIPFRPALVRHTKPLDTPYRVQRHAPNALTLDTCRMRKGDGPWSEWLPVIAVQEILEAEDYHGPVTLLFRFQADVKPKNIQVVIEDAAEYDIKVNGAKVVYAGLPYYVDRSFHPVDITEQVRIGENLIELSRHFEPTAKAEFSLGSLFITHTGVELEAIYLIGDFGVKGTLSPREERPGCVRFSQFTLTEEPESSDGDLARGGYPFFAGRLSLRSTVTLEEPRQGEKLFLTLPNLGLPLVKVRVNGQEAGAIAWAPYRLEITPWAKAGRNDIEIELVTSLRNLLGPHHRPDGEVDETWQVHYSGRYPAGPDWYKRRGEPDVEWTDDYFVLDFGFKGPVTVQYVTA